MTKRFNQRYSDFSIPINNFLQTVYDIISSVTRPGPDTLYVLEDQRFKT